MKTTKYLCDICSEEIQANDISARAIWFASNHSWKLSPLRESDGKHICGNCLAQMNDQIKAHVKVV